MKERFSLIRPESLVTILAFAEGAFVPAVELPDVMVKGLTRLGHGEPGDLCFCDRDPGPTLDVLPSGLIVLCTAELAQLLAPRFPDAIWIPLLDPRAVFIDLGVQLLSKGAVDVSDAVPRPLGVHPTAKIGAHTVIDSGVRIDEGVIIGHHCVIHRGTWIQTGSVVRDHSVIGCEGINAYRGLDGRQRGFPHLAGVLIGERVEIGASTVIPRGILTSTCIGEGSVIGNLCNIGHGAVIEKEVWMSVGCLIGGHTRIGEGATLAMGAAIRDNLEIGAGAQVGMGSVVARTVEPNTSVFGNPARSVPGQVKAGPER
jgi:UDP-3-O-[3-hydroxymyristoyl] glucosamine N-acyltransferase